MRKVRGKFHPRTRHEDPEGEQRYSCTFSLTVTGYYVFYMWFEYVLV